MDCLDEGILHFHNALKLLKSPQPTNKFGIIIRTMRASLVQRLHQNMPGVFTDNKSEESEFCIDQVHCLSFLTKAYHMKKNYECAYLATLEQLNIVEEACGEHWNEIITAYTNMIVSCQYYEKFTMGKMYAKLAHDKLKLLSGNLEDTLTLGQLHLTLTFFHLANSDINNALDSASNCYKAATNINDLIMKISIIPSLVHIYLLKLRSQSCIDLLLDLKALMKNVDNHELKWIYYSCCVDLLLDTGDSVESIPDMINYASMKDDDDKFNKSYIKNGIALWYARNDSLVEAEKICEKLSDITLEDQNQSRYCCLLSMITEFSLHKYRINSKSDTQVAVQDALKAFRSQTKGKGLSQARLYHLQAYFAYLRGKSNRAKLLLEDCVVASKNNDIIFEYEWALASKRNWFKNATVEIDIEQQTSGTIKYILPITETSEVMKTLAISNVESIVY